MTELKPCPFCGGEARTVTNQYFWSVRCRACGTENGDFTTASEAAEAWNTRAEQTCTMQLTDLRQLARNLYALLTAPEPYTPAEMAARIAAMDYAKVRVSELGLEVDE